jgi:hypothetical protein
VLPQQVAQGEDRGLIRAPVTDQLDSGKPAHDGKLNYGLLRRGVAELLAARQPGLGLRLGANNPGL